MKIIITIDQIKKILEEHPPKFPITIKVKGISKKDLEELSRLLQK